MKRLEQFLAVAPQFSLGHLLTEQVHPDTVGLSELTKKDPGRAIDILKSIDLEMLKKVVEAESQISLLKEEVQATFKNGGRIFICGCGATGRLALTIEWLWRRAHDSDLVLGFMAGGDLALIKSIEGFEDHPEFGSKQLMELGFTEKDLLISCTEGGETPFVIGATEKAALISKRPPWFLYCNLDEALYSIERSRKVIENPAIRKISLPVGPMALSGSTRMQAATALLLVAGSAVLGLDARATGDLIKVWEKLKTEFLAFFAEEETSIILQAGQVHYETDFYGMTVLSDTTERSPTFSLAPFENREDKNPPRSLCSLVLKDTHESLEAWRKLLLRSPRTLEWSGFKKQTGLKRLSGFDFSEDGHRGRSGSVFRIFKSPDSELIFQFGDLMQNINVSLSSLHEQVLLKMLLNMHSLLVMGRIGRYESNVMTWVKPGNLKLIDRAIRYSGMLLSQKGIARDYETIARALFTEMETLKDEESIVQRTVTALST